MPSMDQPRHVACVLTEAGKWTYDVGLIEKMSIEFKCFGIPTMVKLDITRVWIILAMFSQAFITSYNYHDKFKKIFK